MFSHERGKYTDGGERGAGIDRVGSGRRLDESAANRRKPRRRICADNVHQDHHLQHLKK